MCSHVQAAVMASSSKDVDISCCILLYPVDCLAYDLVSAHAVRGSTVHLQHVLQLLVDWLEHQLDLLMPSESLARQANPGSWEHRH